MISRKTLLTTLCLAVTVATFSISSPATADIFNFQGVINSSQEVPSDTGSSATGFLTASYDDSNNELEWNITYTGFTATAIHFHNAAAGVNGGVVVNIGDISGLGSPTAGSTTITTALGEELIAERFYVNIHSADFPAGEIRGQVLAVPEPSGLIIFGAAGMLLFLRRREKQ